MYIFLKIRLYLFRTMVILIELIVTVIEGLNFVISLLSPFS